MQRGAAKLQLLSDVTIDQLIWTAGPKLTSLAFLSDPPTASVLGAATSWIENLLLGTVGTTIAIVAVASIGFMMLSGRLRLRQGVTVVVGCFILFGSPAIVAGIQLSRSGSTDDMAVGSPQAIVPSPLQNVTVSYDPHAGASVPTR